MQNLLDDLVRILATDERCVADGKLLKNKVVELALKLDSNLIKILLSSKTIKKHFFVEIENVLVFDKVRFQQFISNKEFLPDSYTAFKNKIGMINNDGCMLSDSKDIVLAWPYKDCILEGGQSRDDAKRSEIFWNETLAPEDIDRLLYPKVLSNLKRIDAKAEHKLNHFNRNECGDIIDNLIIKGNNLLSLHTLKNQFLGKIDLIYIDPPYNPDSKSNTFAYNNTFKHSTWLTFMKNRLEAAKSLLTQDGVLIVAIDENEQAYLGVMLRELFNDYEIHCITIVHNPRGAQGTNFSYTHEYAFFVLPAGKKSIGNRRIAQEDIDWSNFRNWGSEAHRTDAKNCFYPVIVENDEIIGFGDVVENEIHPEKQTITSGNKFYIYPIDKSNIERKWRYARQSVDEIKHLLRAKKTPTGYEIEIGKNFGTYKTVWVDSRYDANEYGTKLVKSLVPNCNFSFPKSIHNVYDCLYAAVGNKKNAIVLDFFAGSGTTAHAVLELNKADNGQRKFILCEQMDYIKFVTVERVKKVIGHDSFVYCELAENNEYFIGLITSIKTQEEALNVWSDMQKHAFLSYRIDTKTTTEILAEFKTLSLAEQRQFLFDILDKNMLYVNYCDMEDVNYKISEQDKQLNKDFYKNR